MKVVVDFLFVIFFPLLILHVIMKFSRSHAVLRMKQERDARIANKLEKFLDNQSPIPGSKQAELFRLIRANQPYPEAWKIKLRM